MELVRVSTSAVSDLACSLRFHTLRIQKRWPPREPPPLTVEFGVAVHEVLRHVYDPRHRPLPCLESLETRVRAALLARRYPDPDIREEAALRCLRLVQRYASEDEDAEATIEVERLCEFPVVHKGQPLFLLTTKIDRVLVRPHQPGHLVIRDYKTSLRRVSMEEALILLWAAKLRYPSYASYTLEIDWISGDGSVERDVIAGTQLRGLNRLLVERIAQVISSEEHPAEPNDGCVHCPLRAGCQPQIVVDGNEDIFGEE